MWVEATGTSKGICPANTGELRARASVISPVLRFTPFGRAFAAPEGELMTENLL